MNRRLGVCLSPSERACPPQTISRMDESEPSFLDQVFPIRQAVGNCAPLEVIITALVVIKITSVYIFVAFGRKAAAARPISQEPRDYQGMLIRQKCLTSRHFNSQSTNRCKDTSLLESAAVLGKSQGYPTRWHRPAT